MKMKTLQLPWLPWLIVTKIIWQKLLHVGHMAAGTHKGRPRVSQARTKAKAKVSTFSGHSSVYGIVSSV